MIYKKYWPWVSIFLLLIILAFIFIWPAASRPLSIVVMILGLGMVVALTIQRHLQAYHKGGIDKKELARKIVMDLLGLLLAMVAAILVGGRFGRLVSQSAWEAGWPEWTVIAAGILTGFAAGFAAGWLVRFLWGVFFKPKRVKTAQAGEG